MDTELHYEDDIKNGNYRFYYKNGNIKQEGTFINDIKDGVIKIYNNKGLLKNEITFKNGKAVSGYFYAGSKKIIVKTPPEKSKPAG